jgi:hypothetical protein
MWLPRPNSGNSFILLRVQTTLVALKTMIQRKGNKTIKLRAFAS